MPRLFLFSSHLLLLALIVWVNGERGAIDLKKVIKSVSFNPALPDELKMIKAINRKGNYSGYIKKLIAADLGLKAAGKKQKDPDREPIQAKTESPTEPEVIEPAQSYGERLEELKRNRNTGGPKLWMP